MYKEPTRSECLSSARTTYLSFDSSELARRGQQLGRLIPRHVMMERGACNAVNWRWIQKKKKKASPTHLIILTTVRDGYLCTLEVPSDESVPPALPQTAEPFSPSLPRHQGHLEPPRIGHPPPRDAPPKAARKSCCLCYCPVL
jgi:hypothetical protein